MDSLARIPVLFKIEDIGEAEGELVRFMAPRTVSAIVKKLPVESVCAVWMGEVYFEVPVTMGEEKATTTIEKGDIAYWPMGNAVCVFFRETRPYSAVNRIGKIKKNLELFDKVKNGTRIRMETC